jgi:hypothetical protein
LSPGVPDRIESAAPLGVVALRHLAPQGEELAALGHPHEDICILHAELAELVRDRFIRHAAILTQLLSREGGGATTSGGTRLDHAGTLPCLSRSGLLSKPG